MIQSSFKYKSESLKMVKNLNRKVVKNLINGCDKAIQHAEGISKKFFNTPGHLHTQTGALRRSIKKKLIVSRPNIIGRLYTNMVYARIHELGGVIKAKNPTGYLHFKGSKGWVKVKQVKIPARPFLYPAIKDHWDELRKIIQKEIDIE